MQLNFEHAAVVSPDREWTLDGGLIKVAKLDVVVGAPPSARLVVQSRRVLVSRILAGASENEIIWELAIPENADTAYQGKTIIIDPGHGGKDGGAQGNSLSEKDINLAVGLAMATEATARGLVPVMTRDGDYFQTLAYRSDQIAANNASVFVSIHSNSNGKANSTSGVEVYYHKYDPNSRTLGQLVIDNMCGRSGIPNRGVRSDTTLYKSGLYVLRNSTVPAILVEVGYMNHSSDAARLSDANFQKQMAKAIVDGVVTYLGGPLGQDDAGLTPAAGLASRYVSVGQPDF